MKTKKEHFIPEFLQIPRVVMHMAPSDRFVFGAIYNYSNMTMGKCVASNVAIAQVANVEPHSVANSLTRLEEEGFIKRVYTDDTKKTRVEIQCLVNLTKKVSSNKESSFTVKGIIDSSIKEQSIILENKTNLAEPPMSTKEVKEFNPKEEVEKLLGYKQFWMNIIGIYIKRKRIVFTNKGQLKEIMSRNIRYAKKLEVFEPKQIENAIRLCEEMKDRDGKPIAWTLETVYKKLT